MNTITPPHILLRQWLNEEHAITVGLVASTAVLASIATWLVLRNLRHNEPGLRAPVALVLACGIAACGIAGANRLDSPWSLVAVAVTIAMSGVLFWFADHRRFVRTPSGKIVADRWRIVLAIAGFRWTRDKANRHFFFTGDTGSGKTSGMNRLMDALFARNSTLGGVVIATKGDEWFFLEHLARKHKRTRDLIHLRVREAAGSRKTAHRLNVTGDTRLPFTTRARLLVDTAASLNPKEEKSFFKVKGAAHIGRALELLTDIGRPATPTNAYELLTSERELKSALEKLTELEPNERRIRLADVFEQTYLKHEAKEQRAGEIGTSQNYLEYLGTPEIAEVFSSNEPDTCSIADIDKGKILCIDVPQDFSTERQYVFTLVKLLLFRHSLRRYALPPWKKYALNQLFYLGDEFQNAITASHDGTSDFNVVDRLRDCMLMLIVSAQAFESLIPPQTKEQAEVLSLNLRNLFMYRAASETDAIRCAMHLANTMSNAPRAPSGPKRQRIPINDWRSIG